MLLATLIATLALPAVGPLEDGEALLRRMNAAHRDGWFTTMTFVQQTSWPGGTRPDEIWYESMERPGKLRIDIERNDSMISTVLFRNDSVYRLAGGTVQQRQPMVHALLVLLHDVHVGDIDTAIAKLRGSGFDLATTSRATWQGRAVTVVGAAAGDTTTAQFWVDPDRLVVVRVIQRTPNGTISDTHIGKFTPQGAALAEGEIVFHANGVATMREVYTQVKTGMVHDPAIFDPANGALPAWVVAARRQR